MDSIKISRIVEKLLSIASFERGLLPQNRTNLPGIRAALNAIAAIDNL